MPIIANVLAILEEEVDASVKNIDPNLDDLISRNMEVINELDVMIQSLSYIHSEISKVIAYTSAIVVMFKMGCLSL